MMPASFFSHLLLPQALLAPLLWKRKKKKRHHFYRKAFSYALSSCERWKGEHIKRITAIAVIAISCVKTGIWKKTFFVFPWAEARLSVCEFLLSFCLSQIGYLICNKILPSRGIQFCNGNTSTWHSQLICSFDTFTVSLSCLNDMQNTQIIKKCLCPFLPVSVSVIKAKIWSSTLCFVIS